MLISLHATERTLRPISSGFFYTPKLKNHGWAMDSWIFQLKEGGASKERLVDTKTQKWKHTKRSPGGSGFFLSTTLSSLPKWSFSGSSLPTIKKPQFSLPGMVKSMTEHPSRFHLLAVQEFFRYTEYQGMQSQHGLRCFTLTMRATQTINTCETNGDV